MQTCGMGEGKGNNCNNEMKYSINKANQLIEGVVE